MAMAFAECARLCEKTSDGKFWKVSGDPSGNFRAGFLLWIRTEYQSLQEQIATALATYDRFIVLGTGCGKSMFAVQFALQAAHEGKILFKKDGQVHVIDGVQGAAEGPYTLTSPEIKEILADRSAWLVIDGEQEGQLATCACRILLACSTCPSNFEELGKLGRTLTLYMSAWSGEEVRSFIADFEPHRSEYDPAPAPSPPAPAPSPGEDPFRREIAPVLKQMWVPRLDEAMTAFQSLGGAARYVLRSDKVADGLARWRSAIHTLGNDINAAAVVLRGSFLDKVSDRIVHIFATENHRSFKKDFASLQTITELATAYYRGGVMHTAAFLERTVAMSLVGPLWGRLYEMVVVSRLTSTGSLECKTQSETSQLCLGERTVRTFSTLEELKLILEEDLETVYCQPLNECLESFDGVMMFDNDVVLIQTFKRKDGRHGLKVAGLEHIDRVLQEPCYEVWSCVPVEHYGETDIQAFTTMGHSQVIGKILQRIVQVDYRGLRNAPSLALKRRWEQAFT